MARELLFYTHALAGGGAERVWARLASAFARAGERVIFAVDFDAPENRPHLDARIDYVVLPRGHAGAVLGLAGLIRRAKPDASLSALAVSNLKHVCAALLAGRASRAAISYHGFDESEPQRLSRIGYRATPLLSRLSGKTVAVSQALARDLATRFRTPREKLVTIYNPAVPDLVIESPVPRRERPPRIVTVGRLTPDKRMADLVRALAEMTRKDAELHILGEGGERDAIVAVAREYGVADRVILHGYVDPGPHLAQARCFALASQKESFGLVVIEALAHGLPVVVTDCGGPAELLDRPGLGTLVPVGDVAALAHALDDALDDATSGETRVARASDFTLDAAHRAYSAVVDGLMQHRTN